MQLNEQQLTEQTACDRYRNSAMCLLTTALQTAAPCLYRDRDELVLLCYQLAICRPATFINMASFHGMCSSNADTRQCLWFNCCTVIHTTLETLRHSTALWRKAWSYTGSAKHANGTNGHVLLNQANCEQVLWSCKYCLYKNKSYIFVVIHL